MARFPAASPYLRRQGTFSHKEYRIGSIVVWCKMGWTARIAIVIAILLVLAAGALVIYGGTLKAPHRLYQVEIPSDRPPR